MQVNMYKFISDFTFKKIMCNNDKRKLEGCHVTSIHDRNNTNIYFVFKNKNQEAFQLNRAGFLHTVTKRNLYVTSSNKKYIKHADRERRHNLYSYSLLCSLFPLLHSIQASMAKIEISNPLPPCLSAPASYPCHSL